MKRDDWSKLALTSMLGVLLSYAFVFLAALPIRYLRLTFGRKTFLLTTTACASVLLAMGLWQWAVVYLSISSLIGFYRELEESRASIFASAIAAIGLTTFLSGMALLTYTTISGTGLKSLLLEKTMPILEQMQKVPRFQEASLQNFLWYLPSGLIITLMLILFVSLTLGRLPRQAKQKHNLIYFRLPDWSIWLFIGSLGATFIPAQGSVLALSAMNVLVITLAAYFFQGLAVFTFFLNRLNVRGPWRLIAYFLIFFQMFIFVSGLGILDFWFDFRSQPADGKPIRKKII